MNIKHLLESKSQEQINHHQCLMELQDRLEKKEKKEKRPVMPNVNSKYALKLYLRENCHNSLFTCAQHYCEFTEQNLFTTQEREALRIFIIRTFDNERKKHTEEENERARYQAGSCAGLAYRIYNNKDLDIILFVGKMYDILKTR